MTVQARAANLLWAAASLPAWRRYRRALGSPLRTQAALLSRYVRDNRSTEYGREFGFSRIIGRASVPLASDERALRDAIASYQSRVPLVRYDDIEPRVRAIALGRTAVLTSEAVQRLTPSSGSTAAAKLLPLTSRLRQEFSRAVDAWLADLFLQTPSLLGGRAYWSISPAIPTDRSGPVPIGFDDDSEYLGGVRRALVRSVAAVPDAVSRIADVEAFRYVTLLCLLRARDLRLVSVWHPSYLGRLLDALPGWFERIVDDIGGGTLSPPGALPDSDRSVIGARLPPDRTRARELRALTSPDPRSIWPALALVSCWEDGPARPHAEELRARLSRVALQPKGLVATEGIVSIPFRGLHPLALTSHFFEFLDGDARPRLAHELEAGSEYSLVLTTGGGLYRYRLGDRVVVDGWVDGTPSVRFAGRDDRVSDRFGEKLSEGFVTRVLEGLFAGRRPPRFAMLAPEQDSTGMAYALFAEMDLIPADLEPRLESALRRNPHYAWCVDLGQLKPARVIRVGPHADRLYVDWCVARGQRLGDVKPAVLHRETGWSGVLRSEAAGIRQLVGRCGGDAAESSDAPRPLLKDDYRARTAGER